MKKRFKNLLIVITVGSLAVILLFGGIFVCESKKLIFSLEQLKSVLYNLAAGVFSSMILVWCVDMFREREEAKEEKKKKQVLYNKLNPLLTEYYEFYLKLYIATRDTAVPEESKATQSLYQCLDELLEQIKRTDPFYKSGYYTDQEKFRVLISLMEDPKTEDQEIEQFWKQTGLPWYDCWRIEATKIYKGVVQLERDFPTFFPSDLLIKLETLLETIGVQKNITDIIERRGNFQGIGTKREILRFPTKDILDMFNFEESVRLLEEVMCFIEQDASISLRSRNLSFFNERNTVPVIGHSCKGKTADEGNMLH